MTAYRGDIRTPEEIERAKERDERIVEMRKRGTEISIIAREVGCSERTVGRVLRQAHLTKGDYVTPPYSEEKWAEVEAWLREEEGSFAEAARTFGMAEKTIQVRFPELGWRREDAGRWAGQIVRIQQRLDKVTYANS